jgi:4-amino-4-deoxy-L-arabinose transferase-like glycosyltransferase
MPLAISVLGVGAFAWLSWRLLPSIAALAATFVYALMPHAYDWVIAGGGITRGLGLLFALLAIAVSVDHRRASRLVPVAAGILLGLAALSHPQAAVFGIIGCLIASYRAPVRGWLLDVSLAATGAAVVVAPWLAGVISTHGLDALLGAGHRLEPVTGLIRVLNLRFSGAPFMDLFAVLGVVGLIVSIARRRPRLPLLLVATYLAGAGGGEFLAAVPWALLGGVGGAGIIRLVVDALSDARPAARRLSVVGLGTLLLFVALIGSIGSFADGSSKLQAISADQLAAMRWVAENTERGTVFVVPTQDVWGDDEQSEWFPALTGRQSVGTVQGAEWLGPDGYRRQLERHVEIRGCNGATVTCYGPVAEGASFYVPKGNLAGPFSPEDCCPALRQSLASAGYEIVYDGPGATVAQPTD